MLTIKFTKRRDGTVISRFERADGTATWQRKDGPQASFFAAHDLTHYALETTLGYRRGFYGLVAEGKAELYVEVDLKPWDLAPCMLLVEEAGGRFSDLDGRRSIYTGTALATNGRLHDNALAMLRR